jgi:hypothetical protein
VSAYGLVETVAQLLTGLEEGDVLLGDLDAVAGARVAPDPGIPPLDRKGPEAAQLDPVAARQRSGDLAEDSPKMAVTIASTSRW